MSMGLSPHNMESPNSVSGSNVMGVPAANMAYERIDNLGEEKRTLVFDKVSLFQQGRSLHILAETHHSDGPSEPFYPQVVYALPQPAKSREESGLVRRSKSGSTRPHI